MDCVNNELTKKEVGFPRQWKKLYKTIDNLRAGKEDYDERDHNYLNNVYEEPSNGNHHRIVSFSVAPTAIN